MKRVPIAILFTALSLPAWGAPPLPPPATGRSEGEVVDDGRRWDIGLQIGTRAGGVFKGSSTTAKVYGGFPVAVVLHEPIARNLLLAISVQGTVDLGNFQMSSQGLDLGLHYVIWGGLRRRVSDFGEIKLLSENPFDLSLVLRAGIHSYGAVSKTNASDSLTGTVYETMGGISYRHDISVGSAFYVQLLTTLLNMPASTERINPSLFEFNLGWRFYL
jgi:hypothetical protein